MVSRSARVTRWIAPSWACACASAAIAGLYEARVMAAPFAIAAGAGFIVLAVLPVLLLASVLARGAWRTWQPLLRACVAPHGGAPLVAGWMVFAAAALGLLAATTYVTTRALAQTTRFRPLEVGYVQPAVSVTLVLVVLAMSRPAARGGAYLCEAIDARWRAGGRRSLLTLPRIAASLVAGIALLAVMAGWWVLPKLGPLDLAPVHGPAIGIAVALALHAVIARRAALVRWIGGVATVIAAGLVSCALAAWQLRPNLTLAAWGELPIAGQVIDTAFDLDAIRNRLAVDAFRPRDTPGAAHPDIVVIIIDTVRADRTPPYGGVAPMPFLEQLAKRGAIFDWAFSPSNVTRRSIPSMLTGLSPNHVRGRVVGWALRIDPRHVVVSERFAAAGYETAGFVCCDGFYGEKSHTGLSRGLHHLEIQKDGEKLAEKAHAWIEKREKQPGNKPLLLYMHILEPHNWAGSNDVPAALEVRRQKYDRALANADKMIAQVVSGFGTRTPGKAPIVIITADHGEALGEHGEPFHSTDLYNSQAHVPFVVVGPGIAPRRIPETVSLTDLSPTIVELAGYVPFDSDGISLAPLLVNKREPRTDGTAYAAMIKDRSNKGGVSMLVRGSWKLLVIDGRRELYDLSKDPGERVNLVALHPEIVTELAAALAEHEDPTHSPFRP